MILKKQLTTIESVADLPGWGEHLAVKFTHWNNQFFQMPKEFAGSLIVGSQVVVTFTVTDAEDVA